MLNNVEPSIIFITFNIWSMQDFFKKMQGINNSPLITQEIANTLYVVLYELLMLF